ncbi:MAG: DUF3135 domain-containing protein [Gammaproteobacteria bacterium]|nr:DUF3135 domain-containing protein [Gammaproteobacteria bacterium]
MERRDEFIFDDWAKLAQSDIRAFELKRIEYIHRYLEQIPERYRQRLLKIQWRIDAERKLASSPMLACLKIYSQMWHSFCGPGGLSQHLNELVYCTHPAATSTEPVKHTKRPRANVIYLNHFRANNSRHNAPHPD